MSTLVNEFKGCNVDGEPISGRDWIQRGRQRGQTEPIRRHRAAANAPNDSQSVSGSESKQTERGSAAIGAKEATKTLRRFDLSVYVRRKVHRHDQFVV